MNFHERPKVYVNQMFKIFLLKTIWPVFECLTCNQGLSTNAITNRSLSLTISVSRKSVRVCRYGFNWNYCRTRTLPCFNYSPALSISENTRVTQSSPFAIHQNPPTHNPPILDSACVYTIVENTRSTDKSIKLTGELVDDGCIWVCVLLLCAKECVYVWVWMRDDDQQMFKESHWCVKGEWRRRRQRLGFSAAVLRTLFHFARRLPPSKFADSSRVRICVCVCVSLWL